jgi:hypothetical protein
MAILFIFKLHDGEELEYVEKPALNEHVEEISSYLHHARIKWNIKRYGVWRALRAVVYILSDLKKIGCKSVRPASQ